jgi:hypothetical protein
MIPNMRPRFLTLAAAALLAGCGADSSVSPSNAPTSLDEVFTEMNLPAISGATGAVGGFDVSTVSTGAITPSSCSYALASQAFVCAPVTANGVTFTQSYQLLNGSGGPLSIFDPTSLAAVRMQTTIAGTDSAGGDVVVIDGRQDQTLSGLQTSRHLLNGTTALNMSGTLAVPSSTPQAFSVTLTTTTTNLGIPAHPSAKTYPASGTIAIDEISTFPGESADSSRIVLTFDGTSKVKVTLDGSPLPGCSTIDLSSATPSCS